MFNPINLSSYHYAANNPVKYMDPAGNSFWNAIYGIFMGKTINERRSNLIEAQDLTRTSDIYQPGAGGNFNRPGDAWCNQATYDVAEATGISVEKFTEGETRWLTTANEAVRAMERSVGEGKLKVVSGRRAQRLANRGFTIIPGWENPSGRSGHLATVRPTDAKYDPAKGPLVSSVGGLNKIWNVDKAFDVGREGKPQSMSEIKYYYDPKQSFDYDSSKLTREMGGY